MKRALISSALVFLNALPLSALTEVDLVKSTVPIGGGDHKIAYGIYIKVGDGGQQRLFQLDTGNGNFLAGYAADAGNNQFWGSGVTTLSSDVFTEGFGSGIEMEYYKVTASVTISNAAGADLAVVPTMAMGQVFTASGDDIPSPTYWNQTLADGGAPLHQTYYGNFGAGVYRGAGAAAAVPLYSALGQIAGITGYALSFSSATPTLTLVYDTPEDQAFVQSFTYATAMHGAEGNFPVTGYQAYSEFPTVAAAYAVNGVTVSGTNGLFDTGGVDFDLTDEAGTALDGAGLTDEDGAVLSGQEFTISFAGAGEIDGQLFDDFTLGFTTGSTAGMDKVVTYTGTDQMNYGPAIYNYYDVYYDLANGVVRFRAVPEPGTLAALLLGVGVLGMRWLWRRRLETPS